MQPGSHKRQSEIFDEVIASYEGKLIRYVAEILGELERAEDVVQETFAKLWQEDLESLQSHVGPWLFKVCRNRAFDICRKEKRMKPYAIEASEIEDTTSGAHARLERNEDQQKIQALLSSLTPNQQEVIRLKFQSDLSYKQIAEITELSESNVGYLIHTGLKKIRTQMNETEGRKSS